MGFYLPIKLCNLAYGLLTVGGVLTVWNTNGRSRITDRLFVARSSVGESEFAVQASSPR